MEIFNTPSLLRLLLPLLLSIGAFAGTNAIGAEKAALVQYDGDAHFGDITHNRQQLRRLAEEAVAQGASLIVFPEGSALGYVSADKTWCAPGLTSCYQRDCVDVNGVAETIPEGATTHYWQDFASQHSVHVVFHLIEKDGAKFYNSIAAVGPQGYVTKYRKRILYGPDRCYASEGDRASMMATPAGRFGLMICADANEGSYYRHYKKLGADAVIVVMDWDQSPQGERAAALFFQRMAGEHGIDLLASDNPLWDGTGFYPGSGEIRQRRGLPPQGIGVEGISYYEF